MSSYFRICKSAKSRRLRATVIAGKRVLIAGKRSKVKGNHSHARLQLVGAEHEA